jgi:hypothetical protein
MGRKSRASIGISPSRAMAMAMAEQLSSSGRTHASAGTV